MTSTAQAQYKLFDTDICLGQLGLAGDLHSNVSIRPNLFLKSKRVTLSYRTYRSGTMALNRDGTALSSFKSVTTSVSRRVVAQYNTIVLRSEGPIIAPIQTGWLSGLCRIAHSRLISFFRFLKKVNF